MLGWTILQEFQSLFIFKKIIVSLLAPTGVSADVLSVEYKLFF